MLKGGCRAYLTTTKILVAGMIIAISVFWKVSVFAADMADKDQGEWSLLTGYGITHPGLGLTKVWVETFELIPRYELVLNDDMGSSWYRCNHSLLIELPVHLVVDPVVSPMFGLNFLANWTFIAKEKLQPYIFIGGGPLYTNADIPGMGAHLNGSYQYGGGVRYGISGNRHLKFEYRFHHISNGGRIEPNDPLNASKFLVGVTF